LRRIRKLEAKTEGVTAAVAELADQRRGRVFEQALRRLETDELAALGPLVEAALVDVVQEAPGVASNGRTTDLYSYAGDARDRRALRALTRALQDIVVGKDEELVRGERHA
jgi:hypothetical protein